MQILPQILSCFKISSTRVLRITMRGESADKNYRSKFTKTRHFKRKKLFLFLEKGLWRRPQTHLTVGGILPLTIHPSPLANPSGSAAPSPQNFSQIDPHSY